MSKKIKVTLPQNIYEIIKNDIDDFNMTSNHFMNYIFLNLNEKYKNFKGFYGCILEDTSGVEIGAVTKFNYEIGKFYNFICEDCLIDGTTVKNIIGREK